MTDFDRDGDGKFRGGSKSHEAPEGLRMPDLDAYPEDVVMRYGLDYRVAQPQRMVWPSDKDEESADEGDGW